MGQPRMCTGKPSLMPLLKYYNCLYFVYSFGVVLWEILTRKTPFSGSRYEFDRQVKLDVLNGIRPAIPDDTSDDLKSLIEKCWQEKPKARPQFGNIVLQLQSMAREVLIPQNASSSLRCSLESVTRF